MAMLWVVGIVVVVVVVRPAFRLTWLLLLKLMRVGGRVGVLLF